MALLALLALTACSSGGSSDAPVDNPTTPENPSQPVQQQKAITFSSGLADEESVTRATGLEEMATSFKVWAYKNGSYADGYQTVIDGYTVNWTANTAHTTTSNTNDWEYVGQGNDQTIKYWDYSATAYRFFATTANATATAPDGSPVRTTLSFPATDARTPATLPYFSKLCYCTGSDYGKTVQLVFVQPYSRVRFMFTFSYPDANLLLTDKSFHPTDNTKTIPQKGTVTVTYPLTGAVTQETVTLSNITQQLTALTQDYYETPEDANARTWYNVLPAQNQGSYTLTVTVNGEDRTAVVPAEYMNWKPGYQYTYIFKITEEGGVELDSVNAAFTNWTEETGEHDVYNW